MAAIAKKQKHVHVMFSFRDWVRLKKRIAEDDKRVTHFVRDVVLAELDRTPARSLVSK